MTDLFDWGASQAAKTEAMARVDEHADPDWKAEMFAHVEAVARERRFFTTDHVYAAAKAGFCRAADRPPVACKRPKCHGGMLRVWESLLLQ